MRNFFAIKDPLTQKRLRRFRERKRACWSLWMLLGLYGISLVSELLCNDRPLYVRYRDRSYLPVFRYYPEDAFLHNGKQTRPDYKTLNNEAAFSGENGNFMIFPPIPHSPYESIDPESLRAEETVTITLSAVPFVGNVNIRPDFTVSRAIACGYFFGTSNDQVRGNTLSDTWKLSDKLLEGIQRRFDNRESPPLSCPLVSHPPLRLTATASLSRFTPRSRPPRTVRLTLRQSIKVEDEVGLLILSRDLRVLGDPPPIWVRLDEGQKAMLSELAMEAFVHPVYPPTINALQGLVSVDVRKNDITWPHPPVKGHWLGIDSAGRDVLARLLYGLRISLTFGLILVAATMLIGSIVGALQGYYGGIADIAGQRLIEIWAALPFLYIMILMGSVFGRRFGVLLLVYATFNWIGISYYMRAEFLRLRRLPFVDSAKCMGIPTSRIMFRHILPNALTPLITFCPFYLVGAIGSLAALDYLGFGLPPPTPSWGEMLHQAQTFRWAWWLILYPSLALFVVVLLGVFIGEGVRDAFDPRRYSRLE